MMAAGNALHPITQEAALNTLCDNMPCPRCPARENCVKGGSCREQLMECLKTEYSGTPDTEEGLCFDTCSMMDGRCFISDRDWDDMFCPAYSICPRRDERFLNQYQEISGFSRAG